MKLAFCGMGSIGKRHLRNAARYLTERGTPFTVDLIRRRKDAPLEEPVRGLVREVYGYDDPIPGDYDAIFVTNPTAEHYDTICRFASRTRGMFIEKPVFSDLSRAPESLPLRPEGVYYVACPLRYASVIRYVREHVDYRAAYAARAISSSYLPDWRPGTDYRDTYSARRALGGGVSIDLIHEWDYLVSLFGLPESVQAVIGRFSALDIDSDDLAVYIGRYPNRVAEVHLDYFGRSPLRKLELFLPEETVEADLLGGTVAFRREGRIVELREQRNDFYRLEMEHFFRILRGEIPNDHTIGEAADTLRIARGEWK